MFKESKTHRDSNLFSFLNSLSTEKMENSTGTLPKTLSSLDYRITEICNSYCLDFLDLSEPQIRASPLYFVKKTIVLRNYATGCDFVVVIVTDDGKICYRRRGDVKWTNFKANKDYIFSDVVLYERTCYAIGFEYTDLEGVEDGSTDLCMRFEVFKLNNRTQEWVCSSELGDQVFLLHNDVLFCVSAKDFDGCKKNCLYVTMKYFGGNDDVSGVPSVRKWVHMI